MDNDEVVQIIENSVRNFPEDVAKAVEDALASIQNLPNFTSLVQDLIKGEVKTRVYAARHRQNVQIRKETGEYGQPSKVKVGRSEGVKEVYTSAYLYSLGGMTLGKMTGDDLIRITMGERMKAEGHLFNVALLEAIQPMVKPDQKVEEAIPEKKLRALFKKVQKEVSGNAA